MAIPLLSLYRTRPGRLAEVVVPGSTDMLTGDGPDVGGQTPWVHAERSWPGCSTAWDVCGGDEWLGGAPIQLYRVGPFLLASGDGRPEVRIFVPGDRGGWSAGIRADAVDAQVTHAWIKLTGTGERKMYVARIRRMSRIDIVGVDPMEVPGATEPTHPGGRVSAQLVGVEVTLESFDAALTAIGL